MMNSSGTVIGKGICIRGEVSGEEDFFLDGVLEGNITLTGKRLTVGANGVIHADIVAGDLVVFGRVEGSVKASGRADRVSVYAFSHGAPAWWAGLGNRVRRAANVEAWLIPSERSRELAALAGRSMQLQINRQDGEVWIADGTRSVQIVPERLQ